jgi:hypothetical protein
MDITTLSSRSANDAATEPGTNSMKHPDLETSSDAPVSTYSGLLKPIVIPRTGPCFPITVACADEVLAEISNLFNIKSLSPFPTWAYSQQLEHQKISQAEFERFVAGVNSALVSNPVLQLTFVVGGCLVGAQGVLPIQVVGGGLQILSAGLSAGLSWYRVRKYVRKANATSFLPRGLEMKVVPTGKMLEAIEYTQPASGTAAPESDPKIAAKLRLVLPPLVPDEAVDDLDDSRESSNGENNEDATISDRCSGYKDPVYQRRLDALSGFVAPLTMPEGSGWGTESETKRRFDVGRVGSKAVRWLNERESKNMMKARSKWVKEEDPAKKEKKLGKVDRKETKVANRVLWIVITNRQGGAN